MDDKKMISVPVRHYHALAEIALVVLADLDEHAERGETLGIMAQTLREKLTRWAMWHEGAEERGLTRWEGS